jgi:serine/threonine protein kinase
MTVPGSAHNAGGTVNAGFGEDAGAAGPNAGPGFTTASSVAGYLLHEQIGRGGMAVVLRATDPKLGRQVALKLLAPKLAEDADFRQRFIRESQSAARIDDPHIIPIFEAGEDRGTLYIAMRYVQGGDVATLLQKDGPLPIARAMAILSPVASALDAAHAAGLVHRDVKPSNMLIDSRPNRPDHVYLSDFGLAKGHFDQAGLTASGQFLGTLDYISPEQLNAKSVDGRADQYSLACAAFELLTGAPPFAGRQATAKIGAHMSEPPPPITTRRPDLPAQLDQIFYRALAKTPADRFATCRHFDDALRHALGLQRYRTGDTPPSADEIPTRPQEKPLRPQPGPGIKPRWTRNWTNWAIITGVSLWFIGLAIYIAFPKSNNSGMFNLVAISLLIVGLVAKTVRWIRRRGRERRIPPAA